MSTTTMCQRCVVRPAARLWNLCLPCFQDWWNTWVSNKGRVRGGAASLRLFADGGHWHVVKRSDPRARALVDGETVGGAPHYSRQTPGAAEFMSSGKTLVLLTDDGLSVWGAIENLEPGHSGKLHWRCAMCRNEDEVRRKLGLPSLASSALVREATNRTFAYWGRRYGGRPDVPLRTEVDPEKIRHKRDPGRCFLRAGWLRVGEHRGLVVLEAPGEAERVRSWRGWGGCALKQPKRGYPGALAKLRIRVAAQRKVTMECVRAVRVLTERVETVESKIVELLPLLHRPRRRR